MSRQIAVINAGSSSIKFAIFNDDAAQSLIFRGQVEKIGVAPTLLVEGCLQQGRHAMACNGERCLPSGEMRGAS